MKRLILAAVVLCGLALAIPAIASAECEVIDGTGEPMTPEKEERFHRLEEECRERIAQAEARRAEEAQAKAADEAAAAQAHEAEEAREAEREARERERVRIKRAKIAKERRELHRRLHTLIEHRARWAITSELHRELPGWVYRRVGSVDCAGGRINRTRWRCQVRWIRGEECHVGRGQVWVVHHTGRGIWTEDRIRWLNGRGYIENGHLYCFPGL